MLRKPFDLFDSSAGKNAVLSNKKKTWEELRCAVKEVRKAQTLLANKVPTQFLFKKSEGLGRSRLYFLGVPQGLRENTLMYVDVPDSYRAESQTELTWRGLFDLNDLTSQRERGFSKEEQLLRERKRTAAVGITSYEYTPLDNRFVFPAYNTLFSGTDDTSLTEPNLPKEIRTRCKGSRMDAKICLANTNLVSFINNSDIWVTNISSNDEKRLTHEHKSDSGSLSENSRSAGVASYIIQEEFDRYTGHWWQPPHPPHSPTASSEKQQVYRILYELVDESDVKILHISSSPFLETTLEEHRYPKAGTTNARTELCIVEFALDQAGKITNVVQKKLRESIKTLFPWMEYIVRCDWTPNGQYVWAQLLSRDQQYSSLVLLPLASFVDSTGLNHVSDHHSSFPSPSPSVYVLYRESSPIWINVHDCFYFFTQDSDDSGEIDFIWASEKSGHRQLYCINVPLHPTVTDPEPPPLQEHESVVVCGKGKVQLTFGEGEVSGGQFWIDKDLFFFMGLFDTPLEEHLYVISCPEKSTPVRLTESGFSHSVYMNEDCRMFVSVHSNLATHPAAKIYRIEHQEPAPLETMKAVCIASVSSPSSLETQLQFPEPHLFSYQASSGCTLYGLLFAPHAPEPGKRYPTILYVYGGPQIQLVSNSHKGARLMRLYALSRLGYAVVVIDSRGSAKRGLDFEGVLKHQLGTVEISEQVEGLQWIAREVDFIDLNRVAIHGWSYGGYLALMGLAQRPDVFKVAIAGAPVTDWRIYDTGYTERYMDEPQNNPDAYKNSSVLNYVAKLPDQTNRLLIVHGLMDENVHFQHTSLLINTLIKACKPYSIQIYPNERHGIRQPEAAEHYETTFFSWLQENL